jgi:hypothetical protein
MGRIEDPRHTRIQTTRFCASQRICPRKRLGPTHPHLTKRVLGHHLGLLTTGRPNSAPDPIDRQVRKSGSGSQKQAPTTIPLTSAPTLVPLSSNSRPTLAELSSHSRRLWPKPRPARSRCSKSRNPPDLAVRRVRMVAAETAIPKDQPFQVPPPAVQAASAEAAS